MKLVNMVLNNVHKNHRAYLGQGEGGGGMEVGEERLYTYCSDESHLNVSLIVRDKVIRLFTNHNLSKEKEPFQREGRAQAELK